MGWRPPQPFCYRIFWHARTFNGPQRGLIYLPWRTDAATVRMCPRRSNPDDQVGMDRIVTTREVVIRLSSPVAPPVGWRMIARVLTAGP